MVKTQSVKLKKVKQSFTSLLVASLQCPPDKSQSLHWDLDTPNFGLRVTANGSKAYIFESSLNNKSIRITIGSVQNHTLEDARAEAVKLKSLIRMGVDPRKIENKRTAQWESSQAHVTKKELKHHNVKLAWHSYIDAHYQPDNGIKAWSQRRYQQHIELIDNVLSPLALVKMSDLSVAHIQAWGENLKEIPNNHLRFNAKLCLNFLTWCHQHDTYQYAVPESMLTKMSQWVKSLNVIEPSFLSAEQLPHWYQTVDSIADITVKAYFKVLLLTGRNAKEILKLNWQAIDTEQHIIQLSPTAIPLSEQVAKLLNALPRTDEFVFSALAKPKQQTLSATHWHQQVCQQANVNLSLDDLTTSYSLFSEWVETPTGVIAQLQGLEITGNTAQHFVKRPLPVLQIWQHKIENWILSRIQ